MMTIYIVGKMTGLPNYNFDRFNAKETELTKKGWRVLNPAKIGVLPDYEMYWPINSAMLDGANLLIQHLIRQEMKDDVLRETGRQQKGGDTE